MRNIAFYISNHGFGHAARNIPLIKEILDRDKEVNVFVKTGEMQGEFIKNVIGDRYNSRLKVYEKFMDLGIIVEPNSLKIDTDLLKEKVDLYISDWDKFRNEEEDFLIENKIDTIVTDIVPWIIKVGKKLGIKTVFISNFTWVEIYREHLSEDICKKFEECYNEVDVPIFYELYNKKLIEFMPNYEKVSFCSRVFDDKKVREIQDKYNKPIIFVGVGKAVELDKEIDVEGLPYEFICTSGVKLKGENVYYLPVHTKNTQDYIKASEFVISKAGWGTTSEAMCAEKYMALFSRRDDAEDRNTTEILKSKDLAIEVEISTFDMEDVINRLKALKGSHKKEGYKNDYKKIVELIMK